jgi:hypothetical protein
MSKKYYSADLTISIVSIKARNAKQAEKRMQMFIDKIAPVMDDKIRWDEADWTIEENVLDKKKGEWVVQ